MYATTFFTNFIVLLVWFVLLNKFYL